MPYVDGFVLAVPSDRIADYKKIARKAGKVWMEHGALSYVEWAGPETQYKVVDWRAIDGPESARAFAAALAQAPIQRFRGTSISNSLVFVAPQFEHFRYLPKRPSFSIMPGVAHLRQTSSVGVSFSLMSFAYF